MPSLREGLLFILEHLEGLDQPGPGVLGEYNLVDVAQLRRLEGTGKVVPILFNQP